MDLRPAKSRGPILCGQTENVPERLSDHKRTDTFQGKYTRKNGPWKLVWLEEHSTRAAAIQRERQIKSMKSGKWIRENLLDQVRPDAVKLAAVHLRVVGKKAGLPEEFLLNSLGE